MLDSEDNKISQFEEKENNLLLEKENEAQAINEDKKITKKKVVCTTFDICIIAIFTALLIVTAFIKIPFFPVPFTLQTMVCLIIGGLLGKWRALISVGLYLFLGLVGLPIFTGGGGFMYVLYPTFGYLIAMLFGGFFVGFFTNKYRGFVKTFIVCVSIALIMTLLGSIYMYFVLKTQGTISKGFWECIYSGFVLFILPEILKSVLASLLIYKVKPLLSRFELF